MRSLCIFFILTFSLTSIGPTVGEHSTVSDRSKATTLVTKVSTPTDDSLKQPIKKKTVSEAKQPAKKKTVVKAKQPVQKITVVKPKLPVKKITVAKPKLPVKKITVVKPKLPVPAKPTEQSPTPSSTSNILAIEREAVRLINIERTKQGLKPLMIDSKLCMIARKKSLDMKEKNYFSHQSPTYGSPFDMLKQFGVSYRTAGENIAAGYSTAQAVVNGWMNSQGHRRNILNPAFTHIGVGYVTGGSYGTYWTQISTG
jgi:uncharacterized YkwD family protein